jgi:hypothetical protein
MWSIRYCCPISTKIGTCSMKYYETLRFSSCYIRESGRQEKRIDRWIFATFLWRWQKHVSRINLCLEVKLKCGQLYCTVCFSDEGVGNFHLFGALIIIHLDQDVFCLCFLTILRQWGRYNHEIAWLPITSKTVRLGIGLRGLVRLLRIALWLSRRYGFILSHIRGLRDL